MDIINEEQIKSGEVTDAYFKRTREALEGNNTNPSVVAEVTANQYPNGNYRVLTGLHEVAEVLSGLDIDVYALEEGRMFSGGPVLRIEGKYQEFLEYETPILGILSHHSGIATNADKARRSAPDNTILSFGARHVHPAIGNIVERNSMIAGLDGFSLVSPENVLEKKSSGTMPHALILSSDSPEEAWQSFNENVGDDVPRIALCDTYTDEVDEVKKAAKALGDDLEGVRLDTTSSRRGDFKKIIKEVRWELNSIGRNDIDIYISGGLGPKDINELDDLVDGFGVGGYISNADPLDFGLDIVAKNGEKISKRGKLPGKKRVYRTDNEEVEQHEVMLENVEDKEDLIKPLIKNGEIVREFDWQKARENLQQERQRLDLSNSF